MIALAWYRSVHSKHIRTGIVLLAVSAGGSRALCDVTLGVASLPSVQGWVYVAEGDQAAVPEGRVFSLEGSGIRCDSIGIGLSPEAGQVGGGNIYQLENVVDPTRPFVLQLRLRVLAEERASYVSNTYGFGFGVRTGLNQFSFGLGPHSIGTQFGHSVETGDNSIFRDYRLSGDFSTGAFELYRDEVLVVSGLTAYVADGTNRLFFGDMTGATNAKVDIASFTFVQPPRFCGSSDFDGDGDFGTDGDIAAFFSCLSGNCCASCFSGGADFNGDGDVGNDEDIESFFRVLAGREC